MTDPNFYILYLESAQNLLCGNVTAGARIFITRWGGTGPVVLVTEQQSFCLRDMRGEERSLLWWRWKLGLLWHKLEKGVYGFARSSDV